MVTDIHDWSMGDVEQAHPVFSIQQSQLVSDSHVAQEHISHCGVCIYDHGGHMGQTLVSNDFVARRITLQNTIPAPLQSDFWYSRTTLPKLRPPIV